jgi:PAS domain S-box-containing protein
VKSTERNDFGVCFGLARAIGRTRTVDDIFAAALDALEAGLGVSRASILLFGPDGVMRFKAWRGLSETYRRAVEGHTPWTPESRDAHPIVVSDVEADPALAAYLPTIRSEHIAAMAFIPLVIHDRVIGKFMIYYGSPSVPSEADLQLADMIATQVAFAVERTRAEDHARLSEERLRFALDAATMGTWDWDLINQKVRWSENLERIHGLAPGSFDGSFQSYEREIHPDDRETVIGALQRAVQTGSPYDVEYRIVAPDGSVRWVEGKGRVEYAHGRPARMSGVCMDVTRRKKAEQARLELAHEASRLKDEFLAVLSHELRTPLNAIVGWVQMLESGALPAARVSEAVAVIGRNARLQAQLIEDILDVSRIITGKLEIARSTVSIAHLAESAVNAVRPSALARGIDLTSEIDPLLPPIHGDGRRLQQVLGNLLSNAVKFTGERGRIHVRSVVEPGWVAVQIADSGVGIEPAFIPFVFDRFRQGDSRAVRRHSGLGLGLAIARYLVEQHGGTISAASDGPGHGATFTVRLPISTAGDSSRVPEQAGPSGAARQEAALRGASMLVVDDHEDGRELLRVLLEAEGALVVDAESAEAAISALGLQPVDVLVADIAMPGMDGYQLVRRAKKEHPHLLTVALTAYARPEDRAKALASGFDLYHSKPFDVPALIDSIAGLLARRGDVKS